ERTQNVQGAGSGLARKSALTLQIDRVFLKHLSQGSSSLSTRRSCDLGLQRPPEFHGLLVRTSDVRGTPSILKQKDPPAIPFLIGAEHTRRFTLLHRRSWEAPCTLHDSSSKEVYAGIILAGKPLGDA